MLKEHNVPEEHIILINLFCTPDARDRIVQQFPDVRYLFDHICLGFNINFVADEGADDRAAPRHSKSFWSEILWNRLRGLNLMHLIVDIFYVFIFKFNRAYKDFYPIQLQMAYALYRGTRLGLALQEALGELEEYEQISPSVKSAVLRKFDETIYDKLENEVETNLTVRADRLWSFR